MKLRLRGHSLRLRLTRGEVAMLAKTGQVVEQTAFGPDSGLAYGLYVDAAVREVTARFADGRIRVLLPPPEAAAWAESDAIGIEASMPLGNGEHLRLLIEKDFACLAERPGEDDSDAYPHPAGEGSAGC